MLGTWEDKTSSYGAQQATTDGLVVANCNFNATSGYLYFYTDATSNPTTKIQEVLAPALSGTDILGFTCPVKKNDYWKITVSGGVTMLSCYWIPIGS